MKLTTLSILLACCLALQIQASPKTLEPAELTMAGWTLEERLALGLHQVSLGHLSQGIATLEDTKDAELDPEAGERLDRATQRAKQLQDSRDRLMRWAVDNKKSLRWPLDDKMVVLKAKSWKDGLLTVRKSKKHELTELRAGEMTMAFLAANFKRKSDDFGADWLEGYCRAMSGDPQWQAALPKKFAQEVLFAADMDQAKQLRAAGPFLTALMEGVQGQGAATMDFERWSRTVKSTRWLGHRKPLLLELATRSFHAQVQEQGLSAAMNASVEELKNGRMRFT
ncbi:MAG: hypothetical protein P1V35_08485, partial [Planctomycetota bacterium]|nr:hypothetical protein [Planctomycetota bacterium]